MKSIFLLMSIIMLLSFSVCNAQIKNAKTETVHIYGNCTMCESTIEKAGNVKKIAKVDWNKDTQMATIIYNTKKTNQDEILKRIALAGYDSDKFLAPDDVYNNLHGCCQYERGNKTIAIVETPQTAISEMDMHNHTVITETKQEVAQLKAVFENYFAIKDALVQTDGKTVSAKATDLLTAMGAVKMELLATNEHLAWMKVVKDLTADAAHIAETKDTEHQRVYFSSLSTNMYTLIKTTQQETPTYLQHCPMANDGKGADWLSKESAIKNPYYGSQMLSCGKTVETINNK
jgi:hypothetical protein